MTLGKDYGLAGCNGRSSQGASDSTTAANALAARMSEAALDLQGNRSALFDAEIDGAVAVLRTLTDGDAR